MRSRTEKSLINITSALIGQVLAIVVGFITRMVFVSQLGDTYLGINGLCTSIVGLLSLAELGVGESINYKLYKPLAERDVEQLKSIMKLYRRVYWIIGVVIMSIGVILVPFLHVFMKASDVQSVNHLYLIFLLFVINSASSYFYSYKRALIIADQKRYIVNIYHYAFYCIMNVLQIIILINTHNFIFYLLSMIACTVGQNILISIQADRLYPFLKDKEVSKLKKSDVDEIKKNTLALLYHKIGSQMVNSTDNILVSKIIGIATVGVYSNYLLITQALNTIMAQLFSAITASVGNLGTTENRERSEGVLKRLFLGNFWFTLIVCAAFYSSIELLIEKMFGVQRILNHEVLSCVVINLYLYNIRRTAWTFRDGYGLFWHDRYKALAETVINLIVSIVLGLKFGLVGILMGTIISTIATSLWIEPYILYKYAFKKGSKQYFFRLIEYSAIAVLVCYMCRLIVCSLNLSGYLGFTIGCFISVIIGTSVIAITYGRSDEYRYYISLIKKYIYKVFK